MEGFPDHITNVKNQFPAIHFLSIKTTDIDQRSQNLCHFDSGMVLKLEVFVFSHNQNDLRFVRYVCHLHLLRSERKYAHALKGHTAREDHGRICFVCVVGKNPNTPNLSPHTSSGISISTIKTRPILTITGCVTLSGNVFSLS